MSRMKKQRRSSARVVRAELARALAIFEHAVSPTREAVPAFRTLDAAIDRVAVHERQLTLRAEQLRGGSVWTRRHLCEEPLHSFPHRQVPRELAREPTFWRCFRREGRQFELAGHGGYGQLQAAYGAPIHEAGKGRGLTGGAAGNRGAARGTLPRHGNPAIVIGGSPGLNRTTMRAVALGERGSRSGRRLTENPSMQPVAGGKRRVRSYGRGSVVWFRCVRLVIVPESSLFAARATFAQVL